MPDEIKVPGIGDVDKKYVIAGVGVAVLIAGIVYIRARKASQTAAANQTAAQAAGTVTDPAGNVCSALDPNSGYCPGSPEDSAWQQQNSGYYNTGGIASQEAAGYTGGVSGAGLTVTDPAGNQCSAVNPATGYCPGTPQDVAALGSGGSTGTVGAVGSGTTISTNSDWMQAALQVLPGGDSSANEAALAGVFGGLTITTAQKNIFQEAVGLIGPPPQPYPTPIKTSDTAAHPGAGSNGTAGPITGLSLRPSGTGVQAKWNPASNASQGYAWALTGPEDKNGNTTGTVVTIHNLKKGTYNFGIQALPGGQGDNAHATVGLWLTAS